MGAREGRAGGAAMTTGEGIFLAAMIASSEWSKYQGHKMTTDDVIVFGLIFLGVLLRGMFREVRQ